MRDIGLNPRTRGGKRSDAKRLHRQMRALFRAVISFDDSRGNGERWMEPGEKFYKAITAAPVPVDSRRVLNEE